MPIRSKSESSGYSIGWSVGLGLISVGLGWSLWVMGILYWPRKCSLIGSLLHQKVGLIDIPSRKTRAKFLDYAGRNP